MSRVEEALRRAAGGNSDSAAAVLRPNVAELGAVSLDLGYYPVETESPDRPPSGHRELSRTAIAAPRTGLTRALTKLAEAVKGKVVVDTETSMVSVEQYRRLASTLHQMQVESGLKKLMISSALPRDGKTLTSTNLALTLTESFKRRVLLIDADLRHPSIHEVFRLPNTRGLGDGLRSGSTGTLPLIEVTPRLTVLPAGTPDRSPMAGLTSERMRSVLDEATERFDWILLDTPPVGLISDASLLAGLVDGLLLVIGAGTTDYAAVKRSITELGRDRIIGVVLNRVQVDIATYEHYADYYWSAPGNGVAGDA